MERPDLTLAFGLSGWEWIVILLVALLLFGRRLPDIMRGLGSSVREFKSGVDGRTEPTQAPTAPQPATAPSAHPS